MTEEELKEILEAFERAGWNPMIPDTPVPFYDCGVPAGEPVDLGDLEKDWMLFPLKLLSKDGIIFVSAKGESMCGAGIESGDVLKLKLGPDAEEGDVVVAYLDGEPTVKGFHRDERGEVWLIPRNNLYSPFKMSDYTSMRIVGKVVGIEKGTPRLSYSEIQQQMKKVKDSNTENENLTDDKLRRAIIKIAKQMTSSRQWFCVYRVLADKEYIAEEDFYGLRDKVEELIPDNDYSINPRDLQRLNVDSFRKRLFFWDEHNAPVKGKRFYEYLAIANTFKDMLV